MSAAVVENVALTSPEADKKAIDKEAKHLQDVSKLIEKYSNFEGFELKPAKIKDIIYKYILNHEREAVRDSIAEFKQVKNTEELEKYKQRKKEFHDANGADAEFPEPAVKPEYEYNVELTNYPVIRDILTRANKSVKKDRKDRFAREKVNSWKDTDPKKYDQYREFKKEHLKKHKEVSLEKLNEEFDSHFYSDYKFKIKISKNKGQDKKTEEFSEIKELTNEQKFKYYNSLLTRLNHRFSRDAQTYVCIFVEFFLREIVTNALFNAFKSGSLKLSDDFVDLSEDKDFVARHLSLPSFVKFAHLFTQRAQPAKKSGKKAKAEKKSLPKKVPEKDLSLDEKIKAKIASSPFLVKHIGSICKVKIAEELGEDSSSNLYKITFSQSFKNFCFNLTADVLQKIGNILLDELSSKRIRSINETNVKMVVSHLLIGYGASQEELTDALAKIQKVYDVYDSKRKESRNRKKKTDDEDENEI